MLPAIWGMGRGYSRSVPPNGCAERSCRASSVSRRVRGDCHGTLLAVASAGEVVEAKRWGGGGSVSVQVRQRL